MSNSITGAGLPKEKQLPPACDTGVSVTAAANNNRSLMIRLLLSITICLLLALPAFAQNKNARENRGIVMGTLIDPATAKAVPYASVFLRGTKDTTLRFIQVADKNGAFEFDKLPFAYYRLTIMATGFANLTLDSIYLREERYDFNLGDIKLSAASGALDEVVVYAEKPLIENKDGKIVYNVGESALSNGASTSELLQNMPLINNDPNGKILLKGKEPKILIDEKPTDLTADQLKDLLESLPGSSIEKIELMMNPPPQFATEEGGVINIVTKKGKIGTTGRSSLSMGSRGQLNFSTNVNYRNKGLSVTGIVGMGAATFKNTSYSKRQNIYKDSSNYFNTQGNSKNTSYRPNFRINTDYELNKSHSIGFTYQGNLNYTNSNATTGYTNVNRFGDAYKFSTRNNQSSTTGYTHAVTLSYTYKGKLPAEVLRVIVNANLGKNDNDKDFSQAYFNAMYLPAGDSAQTQYFNTYNNSFSARLNYDRPVDAFNAILATGGSFQRSGNHNTLNTNFKQTINNQYVPNELLSNDFWFHQNISTVRAALIFRLPQNWKVTAGVQAENTATNFDFVKGNTANVSNNYWNLLPNLTVRKEFSKAFNTALVYRASIRRPGLGELNPNVDYSDPFNIRFGNPELAPSLADNFDWNFSLIKGKYYINASVGFNNVKDIFNSIRTLTDEGKTQTSWQNIATRKEYESSLWGGYTFSKKFRINASAGYSMNRYGQREKQLLNYRDGNTFYTSFNCAYTPTSLLTVEGTTRFNSFASPQGKSRSNITMTFGVQKKLMNKRLNLGFNIVDPFVVQKFTTYTYGSNFNLESFNSTVTRNFRLTVSYQLNKIVKKSTISDKQRKEALEKLKRNHG
jgi:hypothetical protein